MNEHSRLCRIALRLSYQPWALGLFLVFVGAHLFSFEDLFRDLITEFFSDFDVHMSVMHEHCQSFVAGSSSQLGLLKLNLKLIFFKSNIVHS